MKLKRIRTLFAQAVHHCDRLGLLSMNRWIAMNKNTHAVLPILCERGIDESVLIIAFSGGAQKLDVPVHEFFETTKTLDYNRILLRDKYYMYYHYGVDRKRKDWPSLIEYLKSEVTRLRPEKVVCVGTSTGAYAAIIAGHYLVADFVHAFSPQTKLDVNRDGIRKARHPLHRWRMSLSRRVLAQVLDLASLLQQHNGKTSYFVHYGFDHEIDRGYAQRISKMPGVTTLGYPSAAHATAIFLAKKTFLGRVLEIENQTYLPEIAQRQFGGKLHITLPVTDRPRPPEASKQDISQSYLSMT